jgi:hypothetical protein
MPCERRHILAWLKRHDFLEAELLGKRAERAVAAPLPAARNNEKDDE